MIDALKYLDCYLTQCSSNMWYRKINKKYVIAIETINNVDIFLLNYFPIDRTEIRSSMVVDKILSFNTSNPDHIKRFKAYFMNLNSKQCEK